MDVRRRDESNEASPHARGRRHGWLLFAALAMAACGGPASPKTPSASKLTGVLRYYPLEKGMQWSFMLRDEMNGGPGLLAVTTVVEMDGNVALLTTGKELTELRIEKDGIVRVATGAYLLKWPMSAGDRWPGSAGALVEVLKTDEKVHVDAGEFEECIVVSETFRGDDPRMITTTYCPDVGPVMLEVHQLAVAPGDVPASAVARLRSYGPATDFGAKAPAAGTP